MVSPHKLYKTEGGLFKWEYFDLMEYKMRMDEIRSELKIAAGEDTLKRFDMCLDTDLPYEQTEKLTRLIVLMLADNIDADNLYWSKNPRTQIILTTRIQNGDKTSKTLEVEHYNRRTIKQENWDNTVVNRLEFRTMGAAAGAAHTEEQIIGGWLNRLEAIKGASLERVTHAVNEGLCREWEQTLDECGLKPTQQRLNDFMIFNRRDIYTREQLAELYRMCGSGSDRAVANIVSRTNMGAMLFSESGVRGEIRQMQDAIRHFIEPRRQTHLRVTGKC